MKNYGALVVSGTLALAFGGSALAQNLDALSRYSVITSGDLVSSRDIEGRTLVGRNLTTGNSSNYGIHLSGSTPSTEHTLIVQGDILSGGPLNVQRGSVAVGGSTNNRIINYNGGGSLVANTTDYSSIFAELNLASDILSKTASNSSVQLPSGQPTGFTFNSSAEPDSVAYFSFQGADLFGNNSIQSINFNANGASAIVFNVGGIRIDWSAASNFVGNFGNNQWRSNIVWNFYEATEVNFGSHNMMGQVLAPHATVSSSNNIDGSVYAKHLNSNGEVHFPGYGGNVPIIPEPSSAMLGLLGGMFLLRRRR